MTRWLLAVAFSLVASTTRADDLYVVSATLTAEGQPVGSMGGMRIPIGQVDGDRVSFEHRSERLELSATIDLSADGTMTQVGFDRDTAIDNDSGFVVHAAEGTYVPVFRIGEARFEVGLPSWLPASVGRVPRTITLPRERPSASPFSSPIVEQPADSLPRCADGDTLRPSARSAARWPIPESTLVYANGPRRGAFRPVRVVREGFVVEGVLPVRTCEETVGGFGLEGGSSNGDGLTYGRRVQLPSGTALYATPSSAQPFATLRRAAEGFEPLHTRPTQRCAPGPRRRPVCHRDPPEPSGVAQWIIPVRSSQGAITLVAYVRARAESLRDATRQRNPGGGFGGSHALSGEWPTRPTDSSL